MNYLLAGLGIIAALFFTAMFAVQFWRLGRHLKSRHPISYRFYMAAWLLLGLFIASGIAAFAIENIKSERRNTLTSELNAELDQKFDRRFNTIIDLYQIEYHKDYDTEKAFKAIDGYYAPIDELLTRYRSKGLDDYVIAQALKDKQDEWQTEHGVQGRVLDSAAEAQAAADDARQVATDAASQINNQPTY